MSSYEVFKKNLLLATKSSEKNGTKKFIGKHKVNRNASKKPKKSKKNNKILQNREETLLKRKCKKMGVRKT